MILPTPHPIDLANLEFMRLYRQGAYPLRPPINLLAKSPPLIAPQNPRPPSVHGMVVRLEQLGLVTREPGVPRSVRVAIPELEIPTLEEGSPW
jgi:hypothetical protein